MIATETGFALESMTDHPDSKSVRFEFDQDTTPASMAVVAALSEVMGTNSKALEPLQATVDADALDALVRNRHTATGDVHVTLTHGEYVVTVHSYGMVAVTPLGYDQADDRNEGGLHG